MSGPSHAERIVAQYDEAASVIPELSVLNYGYTSDTEPTAVPLEAPEHYCLRLYEHALASLELSGRDVLEVSCGRGGGSSFMMRTYGPASCLGVDLSEQNVRCACKGADGARFLIGDAHALPVARGAFDVVVNIEASHLYEDRPRFFREAHAALRPGGFLAYADGNWADDDCTPELRSAGFHIVTGREITQNVVRALELDGARRETLFDAIPDPARRAAYKDWGGVPGYRAYERLRRRETPYFSYLLRRD